MASGDTNAIVHIDGSVLEGGGQILRMAAALSVLLRKPINVVKIRAGRSTPGLRPQHLEGLKLLTKLCNGKLEGGAIGSTQIQFSPGEIDGGQFIADPGTAGSVCLLLQIVLPCSLFARKSTNLILRGGTNAEFAPHIDYMIDVFRPALQRFGASFECDIIRRGYYPKGGGEVRVVIKPIHKLYPVTLKDRGDLIKISGKAWVAGVLPIKVAYAMANSADSVFKAHENKLISDKEKGDIQPIYPSKESESDVIGSGNGINIIALTQNGYIFGSDALGKKGVRAEDVGLKAAQGLVDVLESGACVDQYLQDQLIILMALADGRSSIRCGPLTLHTKTAIHVVQLMTNVKFEIDEEGSNCVISCDGLAMNNEFV